LILQAQGWRCCEDPPEALVMPQNPFSFGSWGVDRLLAAL